MVISEDIVRQIKEDELFQLGTKEGLVVGLEKGLEAGQAKQAIIGIINMDARGFEKKMIAEVLEVPAAFVSQILEQYKLKDGIVALLKKRPADLAKIAAQLKVHPLLVEVIKEDMN